MIITVIGITYSYCYYHYLLLLLIIIVIIIIILLLLLAIVATCFWYYDTRSLVWFAPSTTAKPASGH